jgi:predicted nucleotidyltransferase
MRDELREIFGREVDLVEKRLITNPFRRHEILKNKKVLYAA